MLRLATIAGALFLLSAACQVPDVPPASEATAALDDEPRPGDDDFHDDDCDEPDPELRPQEGPAPEGTDGCAHDDLADGMAELTKNFGDRLTNAGAAGFGVIVSRHNIWGERCVHSSFKGLSHGFFEGTINWSADTRNNVFSVSKVITAAVLLEAMSENGIGLDDKIHPFLPPTWFQAPGVKSITFRELLQHRSGLTVGSSSTASMQLMIGSGMASCPDGTFDCTKVENYNNGGYGIAGLLFANIKFHETFDPPAIDPAFLSGLLLETYVMKKLDDLGFVDLPTCTRGLGDAFSYPTFIGAVVPGAFFGSGDNHRSCPSGGWSFTVAQLSRFMELLYEGQFVQPWIVDQMKKEGLGLQWSVSTIQINGNPTKFPGKGGYKAFSGVASEAVVALMPNDIIVVAMVNTKLVPEGIGNKLAAAWNDVFGF